MVDQSICWDTLLPVRIQLYEGDCSSADSVSDVFLAVSRQQNLHQCVFERCIPLWRHILPPSPSRTPWLEYKLLPLKWDLPAGALYDAFVQDDERNVGEVQHVWVLTAHFSNYPSSSLAPYQVKESVRNAMFNSLKEAMYVRVGSANKVMNMVASAQDALWQSVQAASYHEYTKVVSSIGLDVPIDDPEGVEKIPVRLLCRIVQGQCCSSYEGVYQTSRPLKNQSIQNAVLPIVKAWASSELKASQVEDAQVALYVCGVSIPQTELDTKLSRLWNTLKAPDGFLYIISLINTK